MKTEHEKIDLHSARAYFLQVVIPEYETFLQVLDDGVLGLRRDLRAFCHAAEACLHMADHVARDPKCKFKVPEAPKSKAYVEHLTKRSDEFAAVRDVANAFKHRQLGRPDPFINSLEAVDERWALIVLPASEFPNPASATKTVLVNGKAGISLVGDVLLFNCIRMWGEELVRIGVIPSAPHIPLRLYPKPVIGTRPSITLCAEIEEAMEAKPILLVLDEDIETIRPAASERIDVEVEIKWLLYTSRFQGPRGISPHEPAVIRVKSEGIA